MSPNRSHASMSMGSTSHPGRESQWFQDSPENPVRSGIELASDPIRDSKGTGARTYQDSSNIVSSSIPPRPHKSLENSHGPVPGSSPRSVAHTPRPSSTDPSLIAAQLAMKTSGQGPLPPRNRSTNTSLSQNSPLRHEYKVAARKPLQNGTYSGVSSLPTLLREAGESEDGDVQESVKNQQLGEASDRFYDRQARVALDYSPVRDEIGVNGMHRGWDSTQYIPEGSSPSEEWSQEIFADRLDLDTLAQEGGSRGNRGAADASQQPQHKGTEQTRESLSGSASFSEDFGLSQEHIIATIQHEYSNPTIPDVGDAESSHTGKSGNGEDKLAVVVYNDALGVGGLDSRNAVSSIHQQICADNLDMYQRATSTDSGSYRAVTQEAPNAFSLIEEFLAKHKIPKKAGYDWFTTLLDWTSELKERRDAEFDGLRRRNEEAQQQMRDELEAKKHAQKEARLMEAAATRLGQELNQANVQLKLCSKDLDISNQKLNQAEESQRATEKTLHQCEISLSAKAAESAIYQSEFEKSKKDLEMNRQAVQDLKLEVEAGRRLNNDLKLHIEKLSGDIQAERLEHQEEIGQYSRHIESMEQNRRGAEGAAAEEGVRLRKVIQSAQEKVATLEAAYEQQRVEHGETIKKLQAQHDGQLRELRGENAENIRMLQSQHTRQAQDLRGEHGRKVQELEFQINQLKKQRDQEVARLGGQILQDKRVHREQLDKLHADNDRKVKTEVEKAMKKQQQRIDALQGTIVGSQDRYYVQISDSSFAQLLESVSQQITDLSAGVGRPLSAHLIDRSLDPTNYLNQSPQERDRRWTIFVRSVCWRVILSGFFEFPLGFGCLGSLGEGFEKLYHLYLLFSRPSPDGMWTLLSLLSSFSNFLTGTSLEFPGDKATNVWRASFFDAFLKGVKASTNAAQQHEGPHTYPGMFRANVDRVERALTDKLLQLSNRQLDSRVPAQIFKLVYDVGILSLQMGSQRAHVMLEPCESGEVIQAGDRFADEGGLTDVDTTVGLMTQPCMVRIGDGNIDTTSEHVIVIGRFISSRS